MPMVTPTKPGKGLFLDRLKTVAILTDPAAPASCTLVFPQGAARPVGDQLPKLQQLFTLGGAVDRISLDSSYPGEPLEEDWVQTEPPEWKDPGKSDPENRIYPLPLSH